MSLNAYVNKRYVREAAEIEIFGSQNTKDQRPYFAKSCARFGLATASASWMLLRHHLRHISPDAQAQNDVVKCILEQGMYAGTDGCGNLFPQPSVRGQKAHFAQGLRACYSAGLHKETSPSGARRCFFNCIQEQEGCKRRTEWINPIQSASKRRFQTPRKNAASGVQYRRVQDRTLSA